MNCLVDIFYFLEHKVPQGKAAHPCNRDKDVPKGRPQCKVPYCVQYDGEQEFWHRDQQRFYIKCRSIAKGLLIARQINGGLDERPAQEDKMSINTHVIDATDKHCRIGLPPKI